MSINPKRRITGDFIIDDGWIRDKKFFTRKNVEKYEK
jgi:hypothetical protein